MYGRLSSPPEKLRHIGKVFSLLHMIAVDFVFLPWDMGWQAGRAAGAGVTICRISI